MGFGVGEYLGGLVLLLLTAGACGAAAWLIVRRWAPQLRGVPLVLALGIAYTTVTVTAHLVPGIAGILTRGTVPAFAGVLLVATILVTRRGERPAAAPERGPASDDPAISRLLAAVGALAVAACAIAVEYKLTGRLLTGQDTTNFQVPTVARWLQEDSIWGLNQFVPDYSNATYPQHGNVLILSMVLPWGVPFVAILASAPYFFLAIAAAYGLARELRAPASTALLAAATFGAVPRMADVGLEGALTDMPTVAMLGAGMLFLLRHHRTGARAELWLAAVALGLAAGTKWYGVSYAGAIFGVWLVATLAARRSWRPAVAPALQIVGIAGLAGGFWLLRNWIETGNPLFPVKVDIAGLTVFDAAEDTVRERGGFTILDYATDLDIWRDYFKPTFTADFGAPLLAMAAGTAGAAILSLRRPRNMAVLVVAGTAALLALLYAATPYSAFGPEGRPVLATASTRYALPALLAAAAATAWAVGRAGRLRPVLEALLLVALLDGLRRGFTDLRATTLVAGALAAAAIGLAAGYVARRGVPPVLRRPPAIATIALVTLIAVAAVGDRMRARYVTESYATVDPVYAALLRSAPSGARVAVAGSFPLTGVSPILPAMGPRLGNHVEYLGEFRDHFLRRYEDPQRFAAALRGGEFGWLIVGRGQSPGAPPEELGWARAAGFAPVAESRAMVLLRRQPSA